MTSDNTIDWVSAQTMLLTDRNLRDSFRFDPVAIARELKIRAADVPLFVALNPDQLDAQADTLVQKRFHEVARLLPMTCAALGRKAGDVFSDYSTSYWPEGCHRHLLDATHFARHLQSSRSSELHTSELHWVEFILQPKKLSLCAVVLRKPEGRRYVAIQILTAFGGRLKQRFVYLAIPCAGPKRKPESGQHRQCITPLETRSS